jgi:hypothetical protein
MADIREQILAAIEETAVDQPGFYGVLSFHFQNGRLTLIRREQTTIPQSVQREENNSHERASS